MKKIMHFLSLIPFKVILFFIELRDKPNRVLRGSNKVVVKGKEKWTKAAPLPSYRYEFCGSVLNDEIYIIGGVWLPSVWFPTSRVEIYTPATDSWRVGPHYPKLAHHAAAVTCDNQLYVVGGNGIRIMPRSDVYAFDPVKNVWQKKASMPTARGAHGLGVIDEKIYAAGGGINKVPVQTLEVYDPQTNSWATKAPMPTAREHVTAAVAGGKLYILGGYAGTRFDNLTTNEAYDPKTNTWEKLAPLPYAVSGLSAVTVGNSIFIIGGEQGWSVSGEVHEYDIKKNIWIRRSDLPISRYALVSVARGNKIHVLGGNHVLMGDDFRSEHDVLSI